MIIAPCPIAIPLHRLSKLDSVKYIAVHCSATRPTAIMGAREIHRMHVDRGFACIKYPAAIIQGHRDFFGDINKDGKIDRRDWLKECPCFDVKTWWSNKL